ncbi:MAG: guanylate kinase [Nanoarchaeota archaeon]
MVLYIISGFTQSGKTTLINLLLKDPNVIRIITCTTRKPREGERDKVDFYFLKEEDFKDKNKFIETAIVHGNYYGTLLDEVKNKLKQEGKKVVWNLDVQGADFVLKNRNDITKEVVTIFIAPAKFTTLIQRIRLKGDVNSEQRIESVRKEIKYLSLYKYMVSTSTSLGESFENLKGIVFNDKDKLKKAEDLMKNFNVDRFLRS